MIKLSVIVPVYNVEDYIQQCIKSIISQSIDGMEIIVVDDGSTDTSINIIKKINDDRIKIISKPNGGLSSARNMGLKAARGKYVYFIDSDDYIAFNTALEEMYSIGIAENADIVVGNAIRYYSKDRQDIFKRDKDIFKRKTMKAEDFLIKAIQTYSMHSAVWFNMYKAALLKNNKLLFKEGFFHEDEDFTPKAFLKSNNISIYPKNFYIYRFREESIMGSRTSKNGYDLINICIGLDETLKELLSDRTVELLLLTSYKYKFKKVGNNVKKFVVKNSYAKKLRLHVLLYSLNCSIYYKFLDLKNRA